MTTEKFYVFVYKFSLQSFQNIGEWSLEAQIKILSESVSECSFLILHLVHIIKPNETTHQGTPHTEIYK